LPRFDEHRTFAFGPSGQFTQTSEIMYRTRRYRQNVTVAPVLATRLIPEIHFLMSCLMFRLCYHAARRTGQITPIGPHFRSILVCGFLGGYVVWDRAIWNS